MREKGACDVRVKAMLAFTTRFKRDRPAGDLAMNQRNFIARGGLAAIEVLQPWGVTGVDCPENRARGLPRIAR